MAESLAPHAGVRARTRSASASVFGPSENRVEQEQERTVVLVKTRPRFPGEREWTLIALDDPGFWEGVADDAEWENYLVGGPEPKHWHRENRPAAMSPPHTVSPARLSLEQALRRLERVRRRGRSWSARCPAHEDRSPSLVVSESPDWVGYPVFFCYAGCTHQAIRDALLERVA